MKVHPEIKKLRLINKEITTNFNNNGQKYFFIAMNCTVSALLNDKSKHRDLPVLLSQH